MAAKANALERKKPKRVSTASSVNNQIGVNGLSKGSKP